MNQKIRQKINKNPYRTAIFFWIDVTSAISFLSLSLLHSPIIYPPSKQKTLSFEKQKRNKTLLLLLLYIRFQVWYSNSVLYFHQNDIPILSYFCTKLSVSPLFLILHSICKTHDIYYICDSVFHRIQALLFSGSA